MTHYVTAGEAKVIAMAVVAGTPTIELNYKFGDHPVEAREFCGSCGRMICHPECQADRYQHRSVTEEADL